MDGIKLKRRITKNGELQVNFYGWRSSLLAAERQRIVRRVGRAWMSYFDKLCAQNWSAGGVVSGDFEYFVFPKKEINGKKYGTCQLSKGVHLRHLTVTFPSWTAQSKTVDSRAHSDRR
jgi:hypothetical protein